MTGSTEQRCEVRLVSCCSCCRGHGGGPALHHPPRHVHRLQTEEGRRGKLRSQRAQALAQRSFVSQSSVERILCVNIDFDMKDMGIWRYNWIGIGNVLNINYQEKQYWKSWVSIDHKNISQNKIYHQVQNMEFRAIWLSYYFFSIWINPFPKPIFSQFCHLFYNKHLICTICVVV